MDPLYHVQQIQQIKILSDERRLAILRILMARPATLSQLGEMLGEQPSQIRHHLKLLEQADLVELVETRVVRGYVEKYYRGKALAFDYHGMILPERAGRDYIIIQGSHDLALESLMDQFRLGAYPADILAIPVGSLDGLIALRQNTAQIAACHLLDGQTGEYNLPYVRHLFPDRPVMVMTLVHREQGLLVLSGNPRQVRKIEDLAREDITLINRNSGSGTRLWLDQQLSRVGIKPEQVCGYSHEVRTHTQVAEAILHGEADVGLGIRAVAITHQLDFVPLFHERFDLVFPQSQAENQKILPLLDYLQSKHFRHTVNALGGYDTAHMGEQIPL